MRAARSVSVQIEFEQNVAVVASVNPVLIAGSGLLSRRVWAVVKPVFRPSSLLVRQCRIDTLRLILTGIDCTVGRTFHLHLFSHHVPGPLCRLDLPPVVSSVRCVPMVTREAALSVLFGKRANAVLFGFSCQTR